MIEMDVDIDNPSSRASTLRHWACAWLTACVTFAVYLPVKHFTFLNFDDDQYITENPFVLSGLSWGNVRVAFSESRGGHYHPLTWVSHMADISAFGLQPGPAHLVNAALHGVATSLAFGFALRCVQRARERSPTTTTIEPIWVAASTALVFGLHPLRIESVAWLAERKDVLSMNFALLSLHAWLAYQRRPGLHWYLLAAVALGLGLLCKPTLAPLPFLFVGLDYWLKQDRPRMTSVALQQLPLLLLAFACVVNTALAQHQDGALTAFSLDAVGDRLTTAAVAYLAYFGKLFWPAGLGIFYPAVIHPPGVGVGAIGGVAALSWLFWSVRTRIAALTFGWFWFLVAPLPVIGLVQFGGQAYADRWTYLPHLGLILGLCTAIGEAVSAPNFKLGTCVTATALAGLTFVNLPHWRDSETLFRHTLAVAPNNFLAHTNLGNALDTSGQLAEATLHYEAAVRLNPTYPEALNNLGTARARTRRLPEAEQLLAKALELRPSLILARYNLGLVRAQLGRQLEGATTWLEVLQRDPADERTLASLSALVERHLLPMCVSGRLAVSFNPREAFVRQASRVQLSDDNQHLREQLETFSACLATLAH